MLVVVVGVEGAGGGVGVGEGGGGGGRDWFWDSIAMAKSQLYKYADLKQLGNFFVYQKYL